MGVYPCACLREGYMAAIKVHITRTPDLKRLLSTDPVMKKKLEEAVSDVMFLARKHASEEIKQYMFDDAREAYRAVHNSVYKRVVGGSLNIFTRRRVLRKGNWIPKPSNRYGNITGPVRGRLRRTLDFYGYNGIDRGMILRWNSEGTANRYVTHMDGSSIDMAKRAKEREKRKGWHNKSKGERFRYGQIGARGGASMVNSRARAMFTKAAMPEVNTIEAQFQVLVDKILLGMEI